MAKIALTMICKDESKELDRLRRCLKTAEYQVDGIFLVFNSTKTDKVSKKARELADFFDVTYTSAIWEDNFAKFRNLCVGQVPDDYDWILWLDADDELEIDPDAGSLKEIADSAKGIDGLFARYNYDFNERGLVTEEHDVIRLYRNNKTLEWVGRIHETLIENRRTVKGNTPDFWVNHRVDSARRDASLERNIRLLEVELESEGENIDPRTLYYLGSSYYDAGQLVKARELLESYLLMSGWDAERAQAQIWLGRIAAKEDRTKDAKDHFAKALIENPKEIEGYIELGASEALEDHFDKAIIWLEIAISLRPDQGAAIARSPFDNKYRPYMILSECYLQSGGKALPTALHWAEKAYEFAKDDVSKNQVDLIKSILEERKLVNNFMVKARAAIKSKQPGDKILAKNTYDKLPDGIKQNPAVLQAMNQLNGPTKWPKKSVVIFCGNSVLKGWGPWSLDSGIGGSEEAVIRISKHLNNLGYKVVVYAEPLARDGIYEGVEWRNYWEMNGQDQFDIFIGWRNPWLFDAELKANKKYLWLHDVMETTEFTEERLGNLDKVMLLSKYHRAIFPMIPDEKVFMTGNGIDSHEFATYDGKLERNPHRIIYTSSHVRGLEHLYTIWPEVKKAVPDATLDIYYGWDSYVKVNRDNPERMAWKDKMISIEKSLDGVRDHGRIGQDQIMEETFKAGVWAYPCPFPEIYCHPAGTKIMTEYGEKNIEELLLTDRVLTHRGVLKPIYQTMRRKARELIRLKVRSGDDLLLTPNHPVYTKRNNEYVWVEARELTTNDVLLTPAELLGTDYSWTNQGIFYIKDANSYRVNNLPTKQHELPEKITLNPKLAKFFGYFAGDGNANERGKVSVLVADKHPEHEQIVLDGFDELGFMPDIVQKQGCKEYRIYSYGLARAFRKYFYDGKTKKLPLAWASIPEVLDGLLAADGHCKNGYNYGFTNTSDRLIGWVKIALAIRGYSGKAQKRVHKVGKISWTISWTQQGKLPQYIKCGYPLQFIEKKIKAVETVNHNDWVYNIEVEEDHSYVSNGSVVHNCIASVKAQAAGAFPVCSNFAALDEMVQWGEKLDMADFNDQVLADYRDKLISILLDSKRQDKERTQMMQWARENKSWAAVAGQWIKEFES